MIRIGILNIQGDVSEHFNMVHKLSKKYDLKAVNVKNSSDIDLLDGLIIPGGESTVIYRFLTKNGMFDKIKSMENLHIMGTCAGAILISEDTGDPDVRGMSIIDIKIMRNAYGRQVDSFIDRLQVDNIGPFEAVFIRAPKIVEYKNARALAYYNNMPVMVENKRAIAMTFHPELTGNASIHEYFIKSLSNNHEYDFNS